MNNSFSFFPLSLFHLIVARCQSDSETGVAETEGGDLGIVGEDAQDFGDGTLSPAPGVDTVCIFPKNSARGDCLLNYINLYACNVWDV